MIHWSCEACLVRSMCTEACEEVEKHKRMRHACSLYGIRIINSLIRQHVKTSPFMNYMERTGKLQWITS